ncbi:Signal peptidase complex subunit SPC2 [Golovinomyces cichoracearum]|uniref:Signal peptidase complex subunit 2 n=1 Tax=Golovinomyces cichoracearum TaxID=62708 RepID=A0A420IQ44_9PEZI|nr:Signal peptidase complex subunit SPC2 [Golovinomyces cichoracearum]
MSKEKICLYSLPDLKNSSDDSIPVYLKSIKFRESHKLCDVRLVVGYLAISISAATFYWDYKYGFQSTKNYTAVAVVLYTILNGFLTYWINFVEDGIIYTGTSPLGDRIQISSKVEKHSPIYNLTITTYRKDKPRTPEIIYLKKSFNTWFNEAGYFVALPFQMMLAVGVPAIGAVDENSRSGLAKKK